MNGHRSAFKLNEGGIYEDYKKSALSYHCYDRHPDNMSLGLLRIGFIRSCKAVDLDREESRFISKFRTETLGLNRIKVVR